MADLLAYLPLPLVMPGRSAIFIFQDNAVKVAFKNKEKSPETFSPGTCCDGVLYVVTECPDGCSRRDAIIGRPAIVRWLGNVGGDKIGIIVFSDYGSGCLLFGECSGIGIASPWKFRVAREDEKLELSN